MRWISCAKGFTFVHTAVQIRLREYQFEGFEMFQEMIENIQEEVATYIMKAHVESNLERQAVAEGQAVDPNERSWRQETAKCATKNSVWTQRSMPMRQRQEIQNVPWTKRLPPA